MQVGSRWCPRRVVMPVMVMMKAALAGLGAALGGGALLLGLTMSSSAATPPPARPPICTTSGSIAALSPSPGAERTNRARDRARPRREPGGIHRLDDGPDRVQPAGPQQPERPIGQRDPGPRRRLRPRLPRDLPATPELGDGRPADGPGHLHQPLPRRPPRTAELVIDGAVARRAVGAAVRVHRSPQPVERPVLRLRRQLPAPSRPSPADPRRHRRGRRSAGLRRRPASPTTARYRPQTSLPSAPACPRRPPPPSRSPSPSAASPTSGAAKARTPTTARD